MPIHNADIAAALDQIADLLELKNDNPFRIRAYRNAARTVGAYGQDIKGVFDRGGELPKLPGIGADLAGKIHEITATGTCKLLEQLQREFPPAVTELLKLPGLGPKRVKTLYDRLKVHTLEELRAAANARLHSLPGGNEFVFDEGAKAAIQLPGTRFEARPFDQSPHAAVDCRQVLRQREAGFCGRGQSRRIVGLAVQVDARDELNRLLQAVGGNFAGLEPSSCYERKQRHSPLGIGC